MNSGDSVRLGTMRVNSTVAFASNFNPSLAMQLTTVTGKTSCVATCIYGTTTYAVNAPGNQPLGGTLQALSTAVNTPCFYLTPTAGNFTASATSQTDVNCFGGSDGTATYTLSGLGAIGAGTYSVDGGTPVAYVSSPVTVTGLNGGSHSIIFSSTSGCSTSANVTISAPTSGATSSESASACDSYTWNVNNTTYTTSGTYTGTTAGASGCPVLVTLNLTINNSTIATMNATACDSYTWSVDNATYTTSGSYSVTSINQAGCTHTQTLNLTVNQSTSNSTTATACDMYTWNGNAYTSSGNYTVTSVNNAGCLHTEMLSLTIFQSAVSNETEVACDTYTWSQNGATYTTSGTYSALGYTSAGCPDYHTLYLTINQSTSNSSSVMACDSYAWSVNGNTYNASGSYTATSVNAAGCTHTEILNLTVNNSSTSNNSAVACDLYTWAENGVTYNASGIYTATSLNAAGCLHTATLNLTVNYSSTSSVSAIACDSYNWNVNNNTYTASGIYTGTVLNNAGCTETVTLNLTVNNSSTSSSSAVACDIYTWNGNSYNASGVYTYTSLNADNCIHTATLALTVNNSTSSSSSITTCDSYVWAANGGTYTTSGIYTSTSLNAVGCTHTSTLDLTVNYSSSSSASDVACDSYYWNVNGTTYTVSGSYTGTIINNAGCTETVTLNVTINNSSSSNSAVTSCDNYTWAVNGTSYNASGVYSHTSVNSVGCTHTSTLNLIVNYSSTHTTSQVACDSYTWNVTGTNYTQSGSYSSTSINTSGCTHTDVLALIVNYSTNASHNQVSCDSYTWPISGSTYTISGVYVSTSLNAAGCQHTDVLNLTVNYSSSSSVRLIACDSYTWAINGMTYTTSGVYTGTSLNAVGCTHTTTLSLKVGHGSWLAMKGILSGAYNATTGLMNDNLRASGLIPTTEPYTASPYSKLAAGFPAGETVVPSVLATIGNNAIVDWVYIELRSSANSTTITHTIRALIQRDGDVVDPWDGTSPVLLPNLTGSYYVTLKHRTHLGVMTNTALNFSLCGTTTVDFINGSNVWVRPNTSPNGPRRMYGSIGTLWGGNSNLNKTTRYNSSLENDKDPISVALGGNLNNVLSNVYRAEDLNMNGNVKYNNTDNDKDVITANLFTIPGASNNTTITQHTPN
jgi:hypothetical protein